jgi:hypothetical protein
MAAVIWVWKSSATAIGTSGAILRMRFSSSPSPVVVVLGDHGAVQGEEDGVTALPDLVDDRGGHLLVGGFGDEARRVGRRSHWVR